MTIRFLFTLAVCCAPALAFHVTTLPHFFSVPFSTRANSVQPRKRQVMLLASDNEDPLVFASGYSPKLDLHEALQDATEIALQALPKPKDGASIDLALVTVSSLYDGQSPPSVVVPAVLSSASVYGAGILNLLGCTTAGIIASIANLDALNREDKQVQHSACSTVESEGVPGVSVTLCLLPNVNVKVRAMSFSTSLLHDHTSANS